MPPKRKPKIRHRPAPIAIEHTGFYAYLQRYMETLKVRHFTQSTLSRRDSCLRRFILWCDERGIETPQQVTKPMLEHYQRALFYYRRHNGEPLSASSCNNYLQSVKQWFKWLVQENYVPANPASELIPPRRTPSLPAVLSVEDVERVLQQPKLDTLDGLRDRAILEVFYSTGIRRTELCQLAVGDISFSAGLLRVNKGKNNKDRVLPLGERAAYWLKRYLHEVRPQLLLQVQDQWLFLNAYGEGFSTGQLGHRVKHYVEQAGIRVVGSCHLLRHAMATHMLENGADIRYIQAMLGHADLNTTQIYTHVAITKLQEIHSATHPAKLNNKEDLLAQLQLESEEDDEK